MFEPPDTISVLHLCVAQACCAIEKGGVIRGWTGNKRSLHGCAQNYSGEQFIASIPDPNLIPSPDPYPAGDWIDDLRRSYGSTIL